MSSQNSSRLLANIIKQGKSLTERKTLDTYSSIQAPVTGLSDFGTINVK